MSNKKNKHKIEKDTKLIKVPHLNWVIGAIILIGTALRFITWNNVMMPDGTIQLKGADAYYFAQESQNIKETGSIPEYDMHFCYPDGLKTDSDSLLYSYIVAGASNFMPVEFATALSGPVFAGLAAIGIFFILKDIFPKNDFAVIVGTAIASLTGLQYIARSYFGFGDRHVLEVFFTVFSIFATLKAINTKKIFWIPIAILCYMLFNFSWNGAPLVILFFGISLLINEFFSGYDTKRYSVYLGIFLPLLALSFLIGNPTLAITCPIISGGIGLIWLMKWKFKTLKMQSLMFVGIGVVAAILIYLFFPSLVIQFFTTIQSYIFQDAVSSSISEFQPMFTIYQNWMDPTSKAGIQVLIHALTAIGLIFMIKKKHYSFVFFGIMLLIISLAKIRGEYYLLIINAISIPFIAAEYKKFAYFAFIVAVYFSMLYWSYEIAYNRNSSLVFSSSDYKMAEWMKTNLPSTDNSVYWTLARWDLGYLYGYLSEKPIFASPNLCNYQYPTEFFVEHDELKAYQTLKEKDIHYVLLKYSDLSKYYSDTLKVKGVGPEIMRGKIDNQYYYLIEGNYYSTMSSRLFNFDGMKVTAKSIYYIKDDALLNTDNMYEAIANYDNGLVYSINELVSPISMSPVKYFKLIHVEGEGTNAIKLFEVIDN